MFNVSIEIIIQRVQIHPLILLSRIQYKALNTRCVIVGFNTINLKHEVYDGNGPRDRQPALNAIKLNILN